MATLYGRPVVGVVDNIKVKDIAEHFADCRIPFIIVAGVAGHVSDLDKDKAKIIDDASKMTPADTEKFLKICTLPKETEFGHFYLACKEGHWDYAQMMIELKQCGKDEAEMARLPIHVVAFFNGQEILKWMLANKHAKDVNVKSFNGKTPLHYATRGGAIECVRLLLEAKADMKCADNASQYALDLIIPKHDFTTVTSVKWSKEFPDSSRKIIKTMFELLKDQVPLCSQATQLFAKLCA